jgi:hypothetical protein
MRKRRRATGKTGVETIAMRRLSLCVLASLTWTTAAVAQSANLPPLPSPAPTEEPAPPSSEGPGSAPAPAPASAPLPAASGAYVHDGFYFRVALGAAYTSLSGDGPFGPDFVAGPGGALTLAIGGTVEKGVIVAGMWHIATGDSAPILGPLEGSGRVLVIVEQLALLVDWYPDPQKGWHAGGAVGLGVVGASASRGGQDLVGTDATASILGGYDWWIAPEWSLGVQLVVTGGTRATLQSSNGGDPEYRFGAGSIGLEGSLLFH